MNDEVKFKLAHSAKNYIDVDISSCEHSHDDQLENEIDEHDISDASIMSLNDTEN